jgi:hypothetical protein
MSTIMFVFQLALLHPVETFGILAFAIWVWHSAARPGRGGMRRLADKFIHVYADHAGDDSLASDFLVVCLFSAIGLVLSVRALLAIDELPEIMALL